MHRALALACDFSASDLPEHYAPLLEILDEKIWRLRFSTLKLEYKDRRMRRNKVVREILH